MSDILEILEQKEAFHHLNGASDEQINEAEQKLQLHFSEQYKEYLRTYGIVSYYGHELTGICNSPRLNVIDVTKEERSFDSELPKTLYVLERINIDRIVIWQDESGKVYRSVSGGKPDVIADSMIDYINDEANMVDNRRKTQNSIKQRSNIFAKLLSFLRNKQ